MIAVGGRRVRVPRKLTPSGRVFNISIMGRGQHDIVTAAISMCDHVRVGTKDYAFDRSGDVVSTHELVKETAGIAQTIGQPLANVGQARKMIGLSGGKDRREVEQAFKCWADPAEITEPIDFLAGQGSPFVTGRLVECDASPDRQQS